MNMTPQFAIVPTGFDPRRIDPDGLRQFRTWITSKILPAAPAYGEFLHRWLQDEEVRQHQTPDQVSVKHLMAIPNELPGWELYEVAQAIFFANEISKTISCEMLGRMFDHQVSAFAHYLAFQLQPSEAAQ